MRFVSPSLFFMPPPRNGGKACVCVCVSESCPGRNLAVHDGI